MIRWTYLFPRIIIVTLIALALWMGSDPLIRFVVVNMMQGMTGAKVEIGQLRCSLENQKIFMKDVAIADARQPMRNLFQAEMAYIEFAPKSLLRREVVIEHSQASGVRFGATRTEFGGLAGQVPVEEEEDTWEPKAFEPIESIGLSWVDQLPLDDSQELTLDELELVQAIRIMDPIWREKLQSQEIEIANIKKTRAKIGALAKSQFENPLRPRLVNSEARLDSISQRTTETKTLLLDLQEQIESDREALQQAHKRDVQKLRQSARVVSFESDSVSRLLLTKVEENYVAEIVGWFHWFRSSVPDPASSFLPKDRRGVDVQFPGVEPRPGFLIKSIDLEGEGRFANRHINFAGTASNLTPTPAYHSQPATFELRAQGDQHLFVTCTLDRRNGQAIDQLKIVCPDLELDGQLLGEPNSMLVTLGPASKIQADIEIQTIDGKLSGELIFRHSNVSLHVDNLHELAGGEDTALRMNQGLAAVNQFQSRVTLGGTVEDYEYEFQSDLGSRFANAVNALLEQNQQDLIAQQHSALEKILSDQMIKIDQQILPEIRRLANQLNEEAAEIASIRDTIPKRTSRPTKIR